VEDRALGGRNRKLLRSRFAALRIRPADRDDWRRGPRAEEWLLIEWPREEAEPIKDGISTLPANTRLADLVRLAKHRWIIERDYQELKQKNSDWDMMKDEAGAAFIITLPSASLPTPSWWPNGAVFPPPLGAGKVDLTAPKMPRHFRPRGSPGAPRAT
jgi:hypothetical protein